MACSQLSETGPPRSRGQARIRALRPRHQGGQLSILRQPRPGGAKWWWRAQASTPERIKHADPDLRRGQRRRRSAQRRQSPLARLLPAPRLLRCARSITSSKPPAAERSDDSLHRATGAAAPRGAGLDHGNHYFDTATLMDLLSVHAADVLDRHGLYSQALVSADVSALEAVYQNNGFSQVKVTPETSTPETVVADSQSGPPAATAAGAPQSRPAHGDLPHRGGPAAARRHDAD